MEKLRPVRKHHTAAQRDAILRDYRECRLTQKEFAVQAGISVSTLQGWLRKSPTPKASHGPAFVAVPNLLSTVPSTGTYRLQWPGGLSLEVRAGFVVEELAALLQLLPSR